jgi:hypothetical protein
LLSIHFLHPFSTIHCRPSISSIHLLFIHCTICSLSI